MSQKDIGVIPCLTQFIRAFWIILLYSRTSLEKTTGWEGEWNSALCSDKPWSLSGARNHIFISVVVWSEFPIMLLWLLVLFIQMVGLFYFCIHTCVHTHIYNYNISKWPFNKGFQIYIIKYTTIKLYKICHKVLIKTSIKYKGQTTSSNIIILNSRENQSRIIDL